jgi:hypothetical protein
MRLQKCQEVGWGGKGYQGWRQSVGQETFRVFALKWDCFNDFLRFPLLRESLFVVCRKICRRPPPHRYYLYSSNQYLLPIHFKVFVAIAKRAIAGESTAYWIGSAIGLWVSDQFSKVRRTTKFFKNSPTHNVTVNFETGFVQYSFFKSLPHFAHWSLHAPYRF